MKRFLTYILLSLFVVTLANSEVTCDDYSITRYAGEYGTVDGVQNPLNHCDWMLVAKPFSGYKFAYWLNIDGVKSYKDTIDIHLNTERKNLLWQATFVRDNSWIYKWMRDSIVFRSDTTDLLSGSLLDGSAELVVDGTLVNDFNAMKKYDHGVWRKRVCAQLSDNSNSGKRLHAVIYNSCGVASAVIDTIVPVVISGDVTSSEIDFHNDTTTDVCVVDGATLTLNNDVVIRGCLNIHEGGKVVVPPERTLEVNRIVLNGNGILKKWGQLVVGGRIINHNNDTIYYDYELDSNEYYPLSLPATVKCVNLINPVTKSVPSFLSKKYDTELRNGGEVGWYDYDDTALGAEYEVGKGYIIYAPGIKWRNQKALRQKTSVIRFPMKMDFSEGGEDEKSAIVYTDVETVGINDCDKNWNLIGNPYLSEFAVGSHTSDTTKIVQGYYEFVNDRYELINSGYGELRYITYTTDGYRSYVQEKLKGFTMKPFNSYFVQTSEGNRISFSKYDRNFSAPRRVPTVVNEIETGIVLSQNDVEDRFGLLYGDFTDGYDYNADLTKMFGEAQPMSVYSLLDGNPMAFQAISIDDCNKTIRVGFRRAKIGSLTFSFDDEQYDRGIFKSVWLYDSMYGTYTNLLMGDYTFETNKEQDDDRFFISFSLREDYDVATYVNVLVHDDACMIYDISGIKVNRSVRPGIYIISYSDGKYRKEVR